ncbi:MAG: hypothetical protein ACF8R9_09760 [Phycisphaerales bacterium JB054]
MVLLIDAFNVLHLPEAVAVGRSLTVADLVSLIGTSRYAGQAAVLVCDGSGDGSIESPRGKRGRVRLSGVEVVFSGPESTADDEIEDRLRLGGGGGMTVVSDDRRLRRAASRVRARSLGSGTFLSHLLQPGAKPKTRPVPDFARDIPLDRYSMAHWMQEFGLTPGDLLERGGDAAVAPRVSGRAGRAAPPAKPDAVPKSPAPEKGLGAAKPVLPELDLEEDPVILAALQEWRGRLRLEDLDMAKWLEERGREKR